MKSFKVFVLSVVAVSAMTLSGCGWADRKFASITGASSKSCVDGVTYLQFTSGATVQVDRQGKPVPCGRDIKN